MAFYSLGSSVQPYNIGDRYIAPWQNFQATNLQKLGYINDPAMAKTAYTNTLSTNGPGAVSPAFYKWLQSQMDDYYQRFHGWQSELPESTITGGGGGWDDYMKLQDPFQDYMNNNPYSGIAQLSRPTRFNLRR